VELGGDGYTLDVDTIVLARAEDADDGYVGLLRNFYFDQYRFFDIDQLPPGVRVDNTAVVSLNETRQPVYPVTFRGSTAAESYAAVAMLLVPGDGRPLSFMLRTFDPMKPDGLFAYSAGIGGDFFAVELVDGGRLSVSANDGGGTATVVSDAGSLSDDRWHTVDLVVERSRAGARPIRAANTSTIMVVVDNRYRNRLALVGGRNTLDLVGGLYVGGVPASIYDRLPPAVRSRRGFSGCLGTFVVNGRLYNILNDATVVTNSVTAGCTSTPKYLITRAFSTSFDHQLLLTVYAYMKSLAHSSFTTVYLLSDKTQIIILLEQKQQT